MMMMAQQSDGGAVRNDGEPVAGPSRPRAPRIPPEATLSPEKPLDLQHQQRDEENSEEDSDERGIAGGSRRLELDEIVNYSINPNSRATPSPISPAGSLRSNNGGGGGGANSATRRIFTPAFKQRVLDAYLNDPECIGNQRATARKFDIHRRQVQKWLQQLGGFTFSDDKNSSDDQQENNHSNSSTPGPPYTSNHQPEASPPRTPLTPPESKPRRKKQMQSVPSENLRLNTSNGTGRSPQIQSAVNPSVNIPGNSVNFLSSFQNMGKTIGNIPHSIYGGHSSNSLLGTNPLLQASLQSHSNTSRPSPRPRHSPVGIGRHGSPPNGGSPITLDIVDELCRIFPKDDFTLLREAILRNEVTLIKLPQFNNRNNRSDPDRENIPSTSRGQSEDSLRNALELFRSHNYLSLFQSGLMQDNVNLNDSGIPWLQSLTAAATMAGYNSPPTSIPHGSNGISENRRRANDQHNFISPRAPVSTAKARTVAVELAEQRGTGLNGINGTHSHSIEKPRRPPQSRRKATNGNARSSAGRSTNSTRMEEPGDLDIDPRSMVEVVTTQPPMTSPSNNSTENGIDLSSTASSVIHRNTNPITTTSTLRSKAMNKDYGFLSELGLSRRESPPNGMNGMSSTASLENFVQNILPRNGSSIISNGGGGSGDSSSNSPPLNDSHATESFEQKNVVLEAFNCDPEVMGDARGVARKFQLNMRVVQKWIREATNRPVPSQESHHMNGSGPSTLSSEYRKRNALNEMGEESPESELALNVTATRTTVNGPGVNRRKNSKPNQICDFTEDDETEGNDPVDMVVPIKKRRVSTPTPTSN